MSFLMSILPALCVLGVLIIIHELGHFLACRMTGVKVEKFSIGFGPEILHWQGKETRYAVSLFPLGGFVKPFGETTAEVDEEGGPKPGDYLAAPLLSRIFIVVAGVLMNYLLAFVLFAAIFMAGRPVPGTTIGSFVDGYPAKTSGLQVGDTVLQVNGQAVLSWREMTQHLETAPEGPLNLLVKRGGMEQSVSLDPKVDDVTDMFGKKIKLKRLGITPDPKASMFERYGFVRSVQESWHTVVFMTVTTHKAIFYMMMGKMSLKAISGPIGIINMTGAAANLGIIYVLQLAATLSISLAVVNLLPIPALDGGHLFFLLIEAVQRKRVSLSFQEKASQIGFFLLLTLMVFIIYNDLVNIDAFGKILGILK